MKRRKVLALLGAPLAWLGCNGLLGIDDATFVPLPDGATNPDGLDGSTIPIGPIRPSRTTVRLPVNETRTIDVRIVPDADAGIFGASDLAAVPGDTLVTASVAKVDTDRFVVTLVGPASVDGPVDTSVRLEGKDSSGRVQMTQNVRVLLGAPGSLDTTFGSSGSVVVTNAKGANTAQSYPLALLGSTPVVADGDGRVHLFENDGISPRVVQVSGCSVDAIAADQGEVPIITFGTRCAGAPLGELGYILPASDAAPTVTPVGAPVLGVALARKQSLNVLLTDGGANALTVAGDIKAALVGSTASSLFSTGDSLFAVGGRQTAQGGAELVLEYTPLSDTGGRTAADPVVYTRVVANATGNMDTAVGTALSPGVVAASWSIDDAAGKDVVYLYILGADGSPRATRVLDAFTARIAGDARGRVVVAYDVPNLSGMGLLRLLPDGGDDGTLPATNGGCSLPAVAVDPDGMIVVSCEVERPGLSSDLVVRRYWP